MAEITSKHIDGITDLVVIAPIKDDFIKAFENITYGTRLKLTAEALNRIRVSAREHERVMPFPDVTQRILNLLDFRVGVIDKNLYSLIVDPRAAPEDDGMRGKRPKPQRYLYLAATFEGGWEPYMRLIWNPLGPFLDLLFCNCDGYVTAVDHSCEEYLQWVRDNQADSAIFYATTGLTTRDQEYVARLERLQRDGADDLALSQFTMPYPDDETQATRARHGGKSLELGLEALTVLYKLADYYPPQWMTGEGAGFKAMAEGQRLFRVAREILRGWDDMVALLEKPMDNSPLDVLKKKWAVAKKIYADPLNWYESGKAHVEALDKQALAARAPDPDFDRTELQSGIIKAQGSAQHPVRTGALLMFTIRQTAAGRAFVDALLKAGEISFEAPAGTESTAGLHRTISFTPNGLLRLGLKRDVMDRFPKEFREGLSQRSGLVGDQREYHPRNWILPARNGPVLMGVVPDSVRLTPVDLDEVDLVLQLRSASTDAGMLEEEVRRLARLAGAGVTLEAVEWLHIQEDPDTGRFVDHFGFVDGLSQPRPVLPDVTNPAPVPVRDRVKLGEVVLGYANDRTDAAPGLFDTLDSASAPNRWRRKFRRHALSLQKNGSYLVVRKIGEDVQAFDDWLDAQAPGIASALGKTPVQARALLKAAIMGRDEKGCPLANPSAAGQNDFDYGADRAGLACPHSAHIRRANPRRTQDKGSSVVAAEFGRPTPRLVRRGMLFGTPQESSRGMMFMAYNASISEQYEVIQRWLNGGNSTDVASANNDPLTGVQPKDRPNTFRFMADHADGHKVVVRATLPPVRTPENRGDEPGRHPFTPLYWGLYLFTPSRAALARIAETATWKEEFEDVWDERYMPMRDFKEHAVGREWITRLEALEPADAAKEWKRLLEDFDARDPTEADISPHIWSAIRYDRRGALNLKRLAMVPAPNAASRRVEVAGSIKSNMLPVAEADNGSPRPPSQHDWTNPDLEKQNAILCAGRRQVMHVLANWPLFSVEEQLRRIRDNSGPIYVTQQPDNVYANPRFAREAAAGTLNYHQEAEETNRVLMAYEEVPAIKVGYDAAKRVLDAAKRAVLLSNSYSAAGQRDYFKIELRRQFILPAIAEVWKTWYGLPDGTHMEKRGWTWKRIVAHIADGVTEDAVSRTKAVCPGDFLSPSRNSFYPRPSDVLKAFADMQGTAILKAGEAFVEANRANPPTPLVAKLFNAIPDNSVLARNIIGTMIGAIPPMDANLRNILYEWLNEKSLWRHQAALHRALGGAAPDADLQTVRNVLYGPISQAMCMRPAPDLLFRTARTGGTLPLGSKGNNGGEVEICEGDLAVVSLVSATQYSLTKSETPDGDVSIVFGGRRKAPTQGYVYGKNGVIPDPKANDDYPVHACPAMAMAMGAMTGIMAALLDSGTIQVLPASLIVKINGWADPGPLPAP